MADEVIKTIKIETAGSEQTVKGLKDEINSLRDALLNAEKGSDEYKDILEQLIADQVKLTETMNAGKNEMKAAEGSYNALVNKMAALKKVWRETTDETERGKIGEQIKGIQEQLKGFDASIGDFRRNVGNYTESIKTAFETSGGAVKGMIGPLNGVKTAFTALSAHPLVAVITLLASLLMNGIAKGFKSSEEATNKLRTAFSGFKVIGDAILNMFQGLAKVIGSVAEGAINLADKLGLLGPKFKARQEMAKKQIELEKKERDNIVKTAQIEAEAAELRAKASDEDNYSISQRIEFLKQAQQKEEEQLLMEKEILEQKYAQLQAQLALTDSTGEELTKLNELKAQIVGVNAKISQAQRQSNKEIAALRKRAVSEAAQSHQQLLSLEKDLIQQEYDLAVDGSEDQLRLAKELRDKELEIEQEGFKTKIKDRKLYEQAMRLSVEKYNADISQLEVDHINKIVARERQLGQIRADAYVQGSTSYLAVLKGVETKAHTLYKSILEAGGDLSSDLVQSALAQFGKDEAEAMTAQLRGVTLEEFKILEHESMTAINDIEDQLTDAEQREVERVNQLILDGLMPMSKYYKEQLSQLTSFIEGEDKIVKKHGETEEEYQLRLNALIKQRNDTILNYHNALKNEQETFYRYNIANKEYIEGNIGLMTRLNDAVILSKMNIENAQNGLKDYIKTNTDLLSNQISDYINDIERKYGPEAAEAFKNVWGGALPTPDIIKKMADESLGTVIDQLNNMGLFPNDILGPYLEALEQGINAEKSLLDQRWDNWLELSNNIADLMGGIGDVWESSLEIRKKTLEKEGKFNAMEQKNLEKSYENLRLVKIAEATVNTISGAVAAYMKCQELGQPWGTVLGAIQAAVVTATGIAEIGKLKHMDNPYSDNSSSLGGSVGSMSATVTPQVSDFNPSYTSNITGREDTQYLQEGWNRQRMFVSVVDINSMQNRVNVTEKEANF